MPIYEYECQDCGVRFERIQHTSDDPIAVCPECCGEVHRVFHPVGIIFKGSGWYVTDNRAKSSTAVAGTKKSDESDSSNGTSSSSSVSTSESSKPDAKPAASKVTSASD